MSDEKIFTMTPEMRRFEATMQLKDLKVGDVLTEQHMGAIDFFLGKLFEAARKIPMTQITLVPDGKGRLVETKREKVPQ